MISLTSLKASKSFPSSFPPACAKSGLPPPFPPVISASFFTKSPAFTLSVKVFVTPTAKANLSYVLAKTITAFS